MIVAIVPAAGLSERMGRPKLLLPLGNRRVIEHVLAALAASQVDRTIAVCPPGAAELVAIVRSHGAVPLELSEQTLDMRASIERGLAHAESLLGPHAMDAFLVVQADQPGISSRVMDTLIERFRRASSAGPSRPSIFIPTVGGRRGHPVLIGAKHIAAIRALPLGVGVNQLIKDAADGIEECSFDYPRIFDDIDTPEDYDRARQAHEPR